MQVRGDGYFAGPVRTGGLSSLAVQSMHAMLIPFVVRGDGERPLSPDGASLASRLGFTR